VEQCSLSPPVKLCERQISLQTSSQCPFCLEKLDTLKKTKEHIGQHQVSLALRALGVYSDSGEHGPEDSVKVSSKDTSSQIDPGSQTSQRPVISFQDRIHIWGPITGVLLKETERKRPRTAAQIQHIHEVKSWGAISTTKEKSKKGTPSAQPTPQTPNIATPISNMTDLINGPASSPFESFNTALSDQPFVFDDLLGNPDMGFPLFSHPPP
jgi:hypothetical protein